MLSVLYTDNEPFVTEWLRNLVNARLLPNGDILERDIRELEASTLSEYRQCHFFAGIGGWPYALQLAGWPRTMRSGRVPAPASRSALPGNG